MEIKVEQAKLYDGLRTVKKAVSSQANLPILSGILLRATQEERLKLVGTDLELGIEHYIQAVVNQTGDIVLPAKHLTNIVRELPQGKVTLTVEKTTNTCQIKCKQAKFNLHGSSAEQFPLLPEITTDSFFKLTEKRLKTILTQVEFAISNKANKPFLTGGLLKLDPEKLKLIGTDTYRLAYKEETLTDYELNWDPAIIPHKTLNQLSKLLSKQENEVKISLANNQILFELDNASIVSRLIEGQFPDYNQVIPEQTTTQATVNKNKLLAATKRSALLAKNQSRVINFKFTQDDLIITSQAPEVGKAYEQIKILQTGKEAEINLNASYLLDCLKTISSDEVIFELSNSLSPGVIKTNSEEEYIYVIMPIRSP